MSLLQAESELLRCWSLSTEDLCACVCVGVRTYMQVRVSSLCLRV